MKGNQNANMSREDFNNIQAKQVANTAYNGNELYDKGIVSGKIFVLPEEMREERLEIEVRDGYIFTDENGNVINATKIVLEKKKKWYPKAYLECCDILGIQDIISQGVNGYLKDKLEALQKLLICRDAYWKIAGEEMGLGKPWEPSGNEDCFVISRSCGEVYLYSSAGDCEPFEFPTEEMRDAFKENFDPDIEICKEFL